MDQIECECQFQFIKNRTKNKLYTNPPTTKMSNRRGSMNVYGKYLAEPTSQTSQGQGMFGKMSKEHYGNWDAGFKPLHKQTKQEQHQKQQQKQQHQQQKQQQQRQQQHQKQKQKQQSPQEHAHWHSRRASRYIPSQQEIFNGAKQYRQQQQLEKERTHYIGTTHDNTYLHNSPRTPQSMASKIQHRLHSNQEAYADQQSKSLHNNVPLQHQTQNHPHQELPHYHFHSQDLIDHQQSVVKQHAQEQRVNITSKVDQWLHPTTPPKSGTATSPGSTETANALDDDDLPVNTNGDAMSFEEYQKWSRRRGNSNDYVGHLAHIDTPDDENEKGREVMAIDSAISALTSSILPKPPQPPQPSVSSDSPLQGNEEATRVTNVLVDVESLATETLLSFPKMEKDLAERFSAIVVLCSQITKN